MELKEWVSTVQISQILLLYWSNVGPNAVIYWEPYFTEAVSKDKKLQNIITFSYFVDDVKNKT